VEWAGVPVVAIDENGEAATGEHDVRSAAGCEASVEPEPSAGGV